MLTKTFKNKNIALCRKNVSIAEITPKGLLIIEPIFRQEITDLINRKIITNIELE